MCHGPDYGRKQYSENAPCEVTKDKRKFELTGKYRVEHKNCTAFKGQDHWEFRHGIY